MAKKKGYVEYPPVYFLKEGGDHTKPQDYEFSGFSGKILKNKKRR